MNIGATRFLNSKRIVLKIGASNLFGFKSQDFNKVWLNKIVDSCFDLIKEGKEVIIVSSGAIAFGCKKLDMNYEKAKLIDKQLASTIGQIDLIKSYQDSFARHQVQVSQIILTIEDIENRRRFLGARKVFDHTINNKIVPIVNQNDAIATAEIRFGDNDRLSARVAQITNADILILLSNTDGLYTSNPNVDKSAILIKEVYNINRDIEKMASDSFTGSGGMSAKVAAAKIGMSSNCNVVIVNNKNFTDIRQLATNDVATWFLPNVDSHSKYIK